MLLIDLSKNGNISTTTKKRSKPLLWIGIGSIIMAFAGLTSGYVVSRTTLVESGNWLVFELPTAFNYSTVVIIASS